MSLDNIDLAQPAQIRFNELVDNADALLPTWSELAPAASAPTLASSLAPLSADGSGDTAGSPASATQGVASIANATVLQLHAGIEQFADDNGLVGSLHGLTNLGETAGLGHIGGQNLVTDLASAPGALASGETAPVGHVAPDAAALTPAVEQLAGGAASDAGANGGLVAPVAAVAPGVAAISNAAPIEALANTAVLDFHAAIEAGSHQSGLSGSVHGLTNLGETVGLGYLGDHGNLLSDVAGAPTQLLDGDTSALSNLPTDATNIAAAVGYLTNGIESDLASGAFLSNPVGNALAFAQATASLPAEALANQAIDVLHGALETAVDPIAPGTIHGITGLGNSIGLGELGGANALTDLGHVPGGLLAGDTSPLANLPTDAGNIGAAVGAAAAGLGGDIGSSSLVDAITHPATGSGTLAGDLPGQAVTGGVLGTATSALDNFGSATGTGAVTAATGSTLGTIVSTTGDVLHAPGDLIAGASNGLSPLPAGAGDTLASAGGIVGAAAGTIAHDVAASGLSGDLAPVASVGASAGHLIGEVQATATTAAETLSGDIGHAANTLGPVALADATGLASDLASGIVGTTTTAAHDVAGTADSIVPAVAADAGGLVHDAAATTATGASALLGGAATAASGIAPTLAEPSASAGAHDAVTLSIGPQTASSGSSIDVLATGSGGTQLAATHSGTANAPTPTLAALSVAPDTLHFPAASGGGSDGLTGALSSIGGVGAGIAHQAAPAAADAVLAHIDMPIAALHVDPLASVAHAVHI